MKITIKYTYTEKDGIKSTGSDYRSFSNIKDFNMAKKEINSYISRKKNYIIKITEISGYADNPFRTTRFLHRGYYEEIASVVHKLRNFYL